MQCQKRNMSLSILKCSDLVETIFQDYCDPECTSLFGVLIYVQSYPVLTNNTYSNGLFRFISSYTMPVGSPRVACMIEMAADGKPPIRKEDTKIPHVSQVDMQISSFKHY